MVSLDHLRRTLYRHSLGPLYDYLETLQAAKEALSGPSFTVICTPETLSSSAAALNVDITNNGNVIRTIDVELRDSQGNLCTWFNGALTPVATKTGSGTFIFYGGVELFFSGGVGTASVRYTGTWASGDTATLTVGENDTVLGYTVYSATCVDTLVA